MNSQGYVALEDGRVFRGSGFGAEGVTQGEVVFNTSMMGYQEIITDPSYVGQIVTMTYPLIGNYGINSEDIESVCPRVEGFIVREYCNYPSHFRSEKTLGQYLTENGIIGVTDVDTRALTKHIRTAGAMRGVIATGNHNPDELVDMARKAPKLEGRDLVSMVSCKESYTWTQPSTWMQAKPAKYHVVALDFGLKYNILRCLVSAGCKVTVVPGSTSAEEVLAMNPDGIFLSNGPGDPSAVTYAVETIKKLLGKKPIFGICLGQQLIGLALGAKTYKLKFGHRGANHPVRDELTGQVHITTQNHGFCVDVDTLPKGSITVTHINLNDMTLEGFQHNEYPLFCVQHHPEAGAGPHDADYLFGRFAAMMDKGA